MKREEHEMSVGILNAVFRMEQTCYQINESGNRGTEDCSEGYVKMTNK